MHSDKQIQSDQFLQRMGLAPNCTETDVRDAYLRLAKSVHPDRGGDAHFFQQLQSDYERALKYAKSLRSPRVHSFFLSPWNSKKLRKEQAAARTSLGLIIGVLLVASIIAMQVSQSIVLPLLIVGAGVLWVQINVMRNLHPGFSAASMVLGLLLFTFTLVTMAQDGFFRIPTSQYSSFADISVTAQLQLGLLAFSGLLVACSGLSLLAALTDQW